MKLNEEQREQANNLVERVVAEPEWAAQIIVGYRAVVEAAAVLQRRLDAMAAPTEHEICRDNLRRKLAALE